MGGGGEGYGVLDLGQINTCRQVPLQVNFVFLRYRLSRVSFRELLWPVQNALKERNCTKSSNFFRKKAYKTPNN